MLFGHPAHENGQTSSASNETNTQCLKWIWGQQTSAMLSAACECV